MLAAADVKVIGACPVHGAGRWSCRSLTALRHSGQTSNCVRA